MPVMRRLHVGGTTYDTVGEASVTQVQTSGTKIATVSIDGTSTDIYAPAGGSSVDPATATPSMDGTAAVGSSAKYAREDHVHPTDTSRQATLVSGTNIKTVNGTSLLGSGNVSIGVSMADTDVDAAVEAAWPVVYYTITLDQSAQGLVSTSSQSAVEGQTVTVTCLTDLGKLASVTAREDATGGEAFYWFDIRYEGDTETFVMPAYNVLITNYA